MLASLRACTRSVPSCVVFLNEALVAEVNDVRLCYVRCYNVEDERAYRSQITTVENILAKPIKVC